MNKKDICQNLENTLEKVKVIEENKKTIKENEKTLHKIRRKGRSGFFTDRNILSWIMALIFTYLVFVKIPLTSAMFDAIFFVLGARTDGVTTLYEKVITVGMIALVIGCYFFLASIVKKFSGSTLRAKEAKAIIDEYNERNNKLYDQLVKESIIKHEEYLTSDALISFLDYLSKDLDTLKQCMGRYDERQFHIKQHKESIAAQKATQAELSGIRYNTARTNKKLSDIEHSVEEIKREHY